jgi:hypothetical protein
LPPDRPAPHRSSVRQGNIEARRLRLHLDGDTDWQSSIDIVLRRFAEYRDLESAFAPRAVTERAKGILMLRDQSPNGKLVDIAYGVVDGHGLAPEGGAGVRARRVTNAAPGRAVTTRTEDARVETALP